jgi:hypothetical protein
VTFGRELIILYFTSHLEVFLFAQSFGAYFSIGNGVGHTFASFSVSGIATTLTGNPSVNYSTHTIVTHLSDVSAVRYEMGYAAALSVFLFLMMALARIGIGKLLDATGK